MSLSCAVSDISLQTCVSRYLSKIIDFHPLHLYLAPPFGVTKFEFCLDLWRPKTVVPDYYNALFTLPMFSRLREPDL